MLFTFTPIYKKIVQTKIEPIKIQKKSNLKPGGGRKIFNTQKSAYEMWHTKTPKIMPLGDSLT